ncbi:unnamed protein product [Choristocarpus tenellus]
MCRTWLFIVSKGLCQFYVNITLKLSSNQPIDSYYCFYYIGTQVHAQNTLAILPELYLVEIYTYTNNHITQTRVTISQQRFIFLSSFPYGISYQAFECGLTPFVTRYINTLILSPNGNESNDLDDLLPKLDAYQALTDNSIDGESLLFTDEEHFESVSWRIESKILT